ncbi:hypothetical protein ACFE04_008541 [Oxalis oulophora]
MEQGIALNNAEAKQLQLIQMENEFKKANEEVERLKIELRLRIKQDKMEVELNIAYESLLSEPTTVFQSIEPLKTQDEAMVDKDVEMEAELNIAYESLLSELTLIIQSI